MTDSVGAPAGPRFSVELGPSDDGRAFEEWRAYLTALTSSVDLVDPSTASSFKASARIYMLGEFMFSDASANHAHRAERTAEDVMRTGIDHINIALHLDGTYRGECDGKPFETQPGDVTIVDYRYPFAFSLANYRVVALMVPRGKLPDTMGKRALHGLVLPRDRAATRLLAQTMHALADLMPDLSDPEGITTAQAVVALAESATFYVDEPPRRPRTADLPLWDKARAEVERRLGDPALSAETLATALGLSRSALYRLFEPHGGVQAFLKEARLQSCYEIFGAGQRSGETIASIGASLGFANEAHLSRSFKARFGLSPRELRARARHRNLPPQPPPPQGLSPHLVRNLGR